MKTSEEFLAHYGVKGMKWGVRKDRTSVKGSRKRHKAPKEGPSSDSVKARTNLNRAKRSGVSALSNNDLQALNNRLQLERTFNSLKPPGTGTQVLSVTKELLSMGKTANEAMAFANSPAGKTIAASLKK